MRKICIASIMLALMLTLSSCGLIKINTPEEESSGRVTSEATDAQTEDFGGEDPPMSVETQLPPYIPDPQKWIPRESEANAMLGKTVNIKYEGSTLFIVDSTETFSSPLVENNVYSEALYKRNQKVSSKHGFKITATHMDADTLFEDYKNTVASGDTFSDLLSVPIKDTGKYITAGLVKNMRSLAFFEHSPEYSIPSFAKASAAGESMYFSVGYSSVTPSDLSTIYFNKSILDNIHVDLYSEILGGAFTIERYIELLRMTESSSIVSPRLDTVLLSLSTTGSDLTRNGYGTAISINADNAKTAVISSASYLSSLLYSSCSDITEENEFSVFEQGDVLFRYGLLSDMDEMYDDKVLWGIAPTPKVQHEGEYITPVNSSVACLMITSNTTKLEMCSVAIGAINAASYKWLLDTAALHYAEYRIPDTSSFEVIKLIIENPILNFAASASSVSEKYGSVFFEGIRSYAANSSFDLSSLLTEANFKSITSEIKKYYK